MAEAENIDFAPQSRLAKYRLALGAGGGLVAILAVGSVVYHSFANQILKTIQKSFKNFASNILSTVSNGITNTVAVFFNQVQSTFKGFLGIFVAIPNDIKKYFVNKVFAGVGNIFGKLFGLGATHHAGQVATHASATTVYLATGTQKMLGIPGIGWAIGGFIIIGVGIALYRTAEILPGATEFYSGISAVVILIGATLGLWGLFNQIGVYILAAGFAGVIVIGIWTVIKYVRSA